MPGVVGGVSPRKQVNGQQPVVDADLLSASTTLQQSGSGYTRLVDALQSLDQSGNIAALLNGLTGITTQLAAINAHLATLDGQVSSLNGQIGVINGQISQLQLTVVNQAGQIAALQTALDGVSFGAVGGVPTLPVTGSVATTINGTAYALPLYPP